MRFLSILPVFALLPACTVIHSTSAGSQPGEFYVTVSKTPFPQGYVLRCAPADGVPGNEGAAEGAKEESAAGEEVKCVRVLNFKHAGLAGPNGDPTRVFRER